MPADPRPRIALATFAAMPDGSPDERPLPAALAELGIDASWEIWDDAAAEWSGFDAVVVRSTWDYQERRDEFLAWARRQRLLVNSAAVIEWNTDKRYLAELAAAGLRVVPTAYLDPGAGPAATPAVADLADAMREEGRPRGGGKAAEVVVKPSVSAGSSDTARFRLDDPDELGRAQALIEKIHADGKAAMVQPFLPRVDERGETALVYLDGELSHSVRKGPLLGPGAGPSEDILARETIAPRAAAPAERELGDRVLAAVESRFGVPAYARVDVLEADDGAAVVLELELTEPALFLAEAPAAVERFAAAIAARLP